MGDFATPNLTWELDKSKEGQKMQIQGLLGKHYSEQVANKLMQEPARLEERLKSLQERLMQTSANRIGKSDEEVSEEQDGVITAWIEQIK